VVLPEAISLLPAVQKSSLGTSRAVDVGFSIMPPAATKHASASQKLVRHSYGKVAKAPVKTMVHSC
jgi:hypothetical protein